MITAWVLIDTAVGTSPKLVGLLRAMQEVRIVDRVTGPHDVIAKVEAIDERAFGGLIEDQIDSLPGVTKTVSCMVLRS